MCKMWPFSFNPVVVLNGPNLAAIISANMYHGEAFNLQI